MRLVGLDSVSGDRLAEMDAEFVAAGERPPRRGVAGEPSAVPEEFFCLVDRRGRPVGTCRLRARLDDGLWLHGGHAGYDVRPSERGKGLATRMLALLLDEARARSHKWLLVTVHEDNPASIRVVERNGARRIDRLPNGVLRYRIDLYELEMSFLPVSDDDEEVVAIGGVATPDTVLEAYRGGIFPWPWGPEEAPLLWWSPDPRFVLYPDDLRVTRSLEQRIRSGRFSVRFDSDFDGVIAGCTRPEGWITDEIRAAYTELFARGHAHCAEAWREGKLAGGLYGVALGGVFFGESMFARESDASKVAFVALVRQLADWGFRFVDCQQETPHLASFGAVSIDRRRFLTELEEALEQPNRLGPWRLR